MKKSQSSQHFFLYVMLALFVWGGVVAIGTFLGPEFWSSPDMAQATADSDAAGGIVRPFDWRKPVIVVAMVGLFIGGWAIALRGRERRLAREAEVLAEEQRVVALHTAEQGSPAKSVAR